MRAIPQFVSAPLNPIPIAEHFRTSHPLCENTRGQHIQCHTSRQCHTSFILKPRKQNKQCSNYERMAKTFDWSIKNGAICICFFVKWQILLGVTLQAYKSSTFPQQHHTLKSSTVWILSLIVCWRTHQKNTTITEKNPPKYNRSWKIFVFRRHYLIRVLLRSIKYRKFDQNWSYRHKMSPMLFSFLIESPQAAQDSCKCMLTIFLQTPSDRTNLYNCEQKG